MENERTIARIMEAVRDYGQESALDDRSGQETGAQFVADMRTAMAVVEADAAAMSDGLKQIAESIGLGVGHTASEIVAEIAALKADAERYRWLRGRHWSDSVLCVVSNPKSAIKLGHDAPSGGRLDAMIDAAMKGGAVK